MIGHATSQMLLLHPRSHERDMAVGALQVTASAARAEVTSSMQFYEAPCNGRAYVADVVISATREIYNVLLKSREASKTKLAQKKAAMARVGGHRGTACTLRTHASFST